MRRKESSSHWWVAILVVVLVLGGFYYWYFVRELPADTPVASVATAPAATPGDSPPAPALPAAPQYPIDAPAGTETPPAAGETTALPSDPRAAEPFFDQAFKQLLGASPLLSWLQIDDFARRVVATVDNLPSRHVAPLVWPVRTTPGQLVLDARDGGSVLGAANAQRYRPLVQAVAAVDTARAVALYRRAYPLLQKAYEDLGYPGRYFNDRLVQVIDHLLATPELPDPVAVVLPPVKPAGEAAADGAPALQRPWVRYEFADPQLEKLSAGQKILLRVGADNRATLKAKLREWRAAITQPSP
ncbi:MAG: DUF3014 domain-containing protein [Comamonas sp.]